jgi:hypothetical protein
MTAGMTTQKLERSRVSLPRAGLGGLLAATLLAGGLIGAAAHAGIGAATAQPAAVSSTLPHYSTMARDGFRYGRPIGGSDSGTRERGRFDLR